jgi:sulfotransferase famil protein
MHIKHLVNRFVSFPFIATRRANAQLSECRRQVEEAGIWFVDIPRTGSTSLKITLERRFGREFGKEWAGEMRGGCQKAIPDHATAREVIEILSPELWRRLFTFSIVRNPWDRCYSSFRFRIANKEIPPNLPFLDYLRLLERKNTRSGYSPFFYRPYFMPMCDFVLDENDEQLVNFIGKFEQRDEVMNVLKEKIGTEFSMREHAQVLGKPGDYRKAYSSEGIEIVARIYRDDIERFQYSFD